MIDYDLIFNWEVSLWEKNSFLHFILFLIKIKEKKLFEIFQIKKGKSRNSRKDRQNPTLQINPGPSEPCSSTICSSQLCPQIDRPLKPTRHGTRNLHESIPLKHRQSWPIPWRSLQKCPWKNWLSSNLRLSRVVNKNEDLAIVFKDHIYHTHLLTTATNKSVERTSWDSQILHTGYRKLYNWFVELFNSNSKLKESIVNIQTPNMIVNLNSNLIRTLSDQSKNLDSKLSTLDTLHDQLSKKID